jgi:hypothetical protein
VRSRVPQGTEPAYQEVIGIGIELIAMIAVQIAIAIFKECRNRSPKEIKHEVEKAEANAEALVRRRAMHEAHREIVRGRGLLGRIRFRHSIREQTKALADDIAPVIMERVKAATEVQVAEFMEAALLRRGPR